MFIQTKINSLPIVPSYL